MTVCKPTDEGGLGLRKLEEWTVIYQKIGKKGHIPLTWQQVVDWGCKALKRKVPINLIAKLAFQATVHTQHYRSWMQR